MMLRNEYIQTTLRIFERVLASANDIKTPTQLRLELFICINVETRALVLALYWEIQGEKELASQIRHRNR